MRPDQDEALERGQVHLTEFLNVALTLVLLLFWNPVSLRAQDVENASSNATYLTIGLGTGTMALAGQLGFSTTLPAGEFTLRIAQVDDFNILGPPIVRALLGT